MSKDKEYSTNSEVNRSKDFQSNVTMKENVLNAIKEMLQSSTDSQFKAAGIVKNEKFGGVYGDKTKYGAGAVENKYTVHIAGKTKTNLTKEVLYGSKRVMVVINIAYNGNMITVEYKTPESGYFRGIDKDGKPFMVNDKLNITADNMDTFKSEIKKSFNEFAKKEIEYLVDTKLGAGDKTEKSTTSTVDESLNKLNMKKLTIKDLYSEEIKPNIDKIKNKNTVPLNKTKPEIKSDKKMFFDEEKDKEDVKEIATAGPAGSGAGAFNTKAEFKNTPYAKKDEKKPTITRDWNVVPESDKKEVSKNTEVKKQDSNGVAEPKSSKNSDPKNGNGKYTNSNQSKAPTSSNDGFWEEVKLIPGSGYVPVGMDQNFIAGMHNASKGDMSKRGYSESNEKNGKFLNENLDVQSLIHTYSVNIEHAKKTNNAGLADKLEGQLKSKLESMGYDWKTDAYALEVLGDFISENKIQKPDLNKKKFFSLSENNQQHVNKRYLITEKSSKEYEQERWKKLSSFKTYESIKEAEEMNEFFDSIKENTDITKSPIFTKKKLTESASHDDIFNESTAPVVQNNEHGEETVNVEKPSSKFGTAYKFFKKDFLNENKHFILDLSSMTYVPNPNYKKV